jgi:hypothetical protein
MEVLFSILRHLVATQVPPSLQTSLRDAGWAAALSGLALFLISLALGFLGWGCDLSLVPVLGPARAAFATGGILLGLALIVLLIVWLVLRPRRQETPRALPASELEALIDLLAKPLAAGAGAAQDKLQEDAVPLSVASLCAGFVVGMFLNGRRR